MTQPDALDRAVAHARAWRAGSDQRPVAATASVDELRARIGGALPETGTPPARVIDELVAATAGGLHGSSSGRFFAWVIGGAVDAALAADWLVATWDQNAALVACGPAVAVVEEIAGAWLTELLDLPRDASFAFTTGCQLAHTTGLAAARHRVLAGAGWDVEADGLYGAPRIRVLASAERHGTVDRSIRMLGLGTRALESLAVDDHGAVRADALRAALAAGRGPTIVVLDAADLNIGACDRFAELIPIAHDHGAWVHVDGAFGLFARASRAKRALLDGIELADSWATDAHKWLNVPYDCGIAIVRDRDAHRAAMTMAASYLVAEHGGARDQVDWTPELSRRARGVPVYAALRELGREGVAALVDRTCAHCAALVRGIGALPGAEIAWAPTLNQGLVRFGDDARTDAVIAAINATGEAMFSPTTWRGRRAMRVSVVSWRTSAEDVRRTVAAVATALLQVA